MDKHNFDIKQGLHGVTILFCSQCGTSYFMEVNPNTNKVTWQAMTFKDEQGQETYQDHACQAWDGMR